MSSTGTRITMPPSVTSMIWSPSADREDGDDRVLAALELDVVEPCPPRPVIR